MYPNGYSLKQSINIRKLTLMLTSLFTITIHCRIGDYLKSNLFGILVMLLPLQTHALAVVDDAGQVVHLAQPAKRIVSLAPHLTELIFAAGAGNEVLATSSASDWPPQAANLPRISDDRSIDFERLVKLKPDLILLWHSGTATVMRARAQTLGIPIFLSEPRTFEDVATTIERLGVLTNNIKTAQIKANEVRLEANKLAQRYAKKSQVSVFYQAWSRPLMTLNGQHFISHLIKLCGGENISSQNKISVPIVDIEAVVTANPEVILTTKSNQHPPLDFSIWQRLPQMTATQNRAFIALDPDLLTRPTPRALLATYQICKVLDTVRQTRILKKTNTTTPSPSGHLK